MLKSLYHRNLHQNQFGGRESDEFTNVPKKNEFSNLGSLGGKYIHHHDETTWGRDHAELGIAKWKSYDI